MKSQLGLGLLLVLALGFASVSPIRSYYNYEDTETPSPEAGLSVPESGQASNETSGVMVEPSTVQTNDEHEQSKRTDPPQGLGMPSTAGQQDPAGADQQSPQQLQPGEPQRGGLSEPANAPITSAETTARGFGQDTFSGIMGQPAGNGPPQQPQIGGGPEMGLGPQGPSAIDPQVPHSDLPTIIERDRPVGPETSMQLSAQQQQQSQSSQQQQQQQPTSQANSTSVASTARTFDSWTNCVGATSNKYGTCKNDVECNKNKGRGDGSCMGGLGVCCVMALTCGDKSVENNTFFANPDFPEPSWEARLCEVEVKKKHNKILQIMIEFEEFELAPPNHEGECITDVFQVKLASNRPSPYSLLRICGQNTGQHMYLDVSQIDEPLVLSMATSGGGFPRRWSIRIVQMDDKNYLLAPPGCLQYYTDTVGHFRSFNIGRNLRNLYYAVCFRIDNGYSGIRFTSNFFGMNGPFCRRRIGGGAGGRHNATIGAHPHHLVIPPPGYAPMRPKPYAGGPLPLQPQAYPAGPPTLQPQLAYGQTQVIQGQRYRRSAPVAPATQRTLHEHEHEKELKDEHEKEFKHEQKHHPQYYPPPPSAYGPGPQPGGYGPAPPPPPHAYGGYQGASGEYYHQPQYGEHGRKEDYKEEKKSEKGWRDRFGWSSGKEESKQEKKHGDHYPTQQYGQAYGQSYGPTGYGYQEEYGHKHPHQNPHQHQHPHHQHPHHQHPHEHQHHHHHKEIDQFGQRYEHLEYKHEKNHHHGKEYEKEGKDEKGGWWPLWGGAKDDKKDKKDKDKFYQHHEALFPMMRMPEMPQCEPRFCGQSDVITFPPSGDSMAEMCGNTFNRGRGPKIISGSPLVVYVSNRGHNRGSGFDMNYEQVFYIPRPYGK